MTQYAHWPKSIWYVYDVLGAMHIMSLNHTDDAPVLILHADVGEVDREYVLACFPGASDDEVDELLGYVTAYASTPAANADTEEPASATTTSVTAAPSVPKRRARKPKPEAVVAKTESVAPVSEAVPDVVHAPAVVPAPEDTFHGLGIGTDPDLMPDW